MELLYLSHCSPDAPDKGDKIRAHHFLKRLAQRHRVHLVCFTRNPAETQAAREIPSLASVWTEELSGRGPLIKAGLGFLAGNSVSEAYYRSKAMRRAVAALESKLDGVLVYSSVMAPYAPANVPLVLDLCDLDSEKWAAYAAMRQPGWLYAMEAQRLRKVEDQMIRRAISTIVMTEHEAGMVEVAIPGSRVEAIANGVDYDYWSPDAATSAATGPSVIFVGQLDYFPNTDGVEWFARQVMPKLKEERPEFRFVVAGRNPGASLQDLHQQGLIELHADPPDVRPLIHAATAVVTPLQLARGLQNKVLEALALGKRVYASNPVCETFGHGLPAGVIRCLDAGDFVRELAALPAHLLSDPAIRDSVRTQFDWDQSVERLDTLLQQAQRSAPPRH